METNRKSRPLPFLLVLLLPALLCICDDVDSSCSRPDSDFRCHTDYNDTITCVWEGAGASVHASAACTANATKTEPPPRPLNKFSRRSCELKPVDVSAPSPLSCTMHLRKPRAFQSFEEWSVVAVCDSQSQTAIVFKPSCSVKLNPPGRPHVNYTTVSWTSQVRTGARITYFTSELQWKEKDQSWKDSRVEEAGCKHSCEKQLGPEKLVIGQTYEARTRVLVDEKPFGSTWSDWSPTTSWVSPVGKTNPPDITGDAWGMITAGAVTLAVFMVVILLRTKTSTWVVKMIRGPPTPTPATSFLQKADFQSWLSPHFSESFYSFMKHEEILHVEVAHPVDAVAPRAPDSAPLGTSDGGSGSVSSCYSNPNYSHLCSPPPFSSLSAGNLQPCAADTPYGPVAGRGAADEAERTKGGGDGEILRLLRGGGADGESVRVISDYESAEKLQVERARLRSLDSGVCSGEEASQESLESDGVAVGDGPDEEKSGNDEEADFRRLFGGGGGISGGSIQLCSGYERVPRLRADGGLELPSSDSGVSSGGEEQGSQEEDVDKATESAGFPFPPAPPFPLPRPTWSVPHPPLKASGLGVRPDLPPVLHHLLARNSLMPTSRSVAPSGDGYMPVKQEQS